MTDRDDADDEPEPITVRLMRYEPESGEPAEVDADSYEPVEHGGWATIEDGAGIVNSETIEFPEALEEWGNVEIVRLEAGGGVAFDVMVDEPRHISGPSPVSGTAQVVFYPGDLDLRIEGAPGTSIDFGGVVA